MKPIYLAVAYRWGWLNYHSYFVAIGHDERKVVLEAESECRGRGGKYGVEILKFTDGEGSHKQIKYFPSTYGEKYPGENHRIGKFKDVGQEIVCHYELKKKIQSKEEIVKIIKRAEGREEFYNDLANKLHKIKEVSHAKENQKGRSDDRA